MFLFTALAAGIIHIMEEKITYRPYLISTLIMIIGGWGGLALLLNYTMPTIWPRWGFFALIVIAFTGTALPLVYFLNLRFPSTPPVLPGVIVRQALWFGVYGAVLAWLQLARVLNFNLGMWLALGLMVIEYLWRWRERNR
jgi:hypothetical protein